MRRRISTLLWLAGCCTALASCHSGWFTHVGTVARPEGRIALEAGGPHTGAWQNADLIVRYTYVRKPNALQLEGTVKLGARLKKSFDTVKNFSVLASFMDAENRILQTAVLVSLGNSVIRPWSFSRALELPPQVAAFNFSYRGTAFDGGGETGRVSGSFWKTP